MGWIEQIRQFTVYLKKYRHILLVLIVGIVLMLLPESEQNELSECGAQVQEIPVLQDELEDILCLIAGAGNVEVLLTEAVGEETVFQTNTIESSHDLRRETVLIRNASREESGLIRQTIPPIYQGAIILCQGADSAEIRLAIVSAVMSATGLSSDRITVLKMK